MASHTIDRLWDVFSHTGQVIPECEVFDGYYSYFCVLLQVAFQPLFLAFPLLALIVLNIIYENF